MLMVKPQTPDARRRTLDAGRLTPDAGRQTPDAARRLYYLVNQWYNIHL